MATPPEVKRENGYVVDQGTGLYVPQTYRPPLSSHSVTASRLGKPAINTAGYGSGLRLDRDPDNLIVHWPERGSGLDDLASGAIVDGTIANVGASPVIAPQISALVRRQQDQAATAALSLTGRVTPVRKAKEALLRFNDSPLGSTHAVMKMVHDLRTYNRGAPIATVPLHYGIDEWTAYGMEALPIQDDKGKDTGLYYLEVNRSRAGAPVPYLPSVFDLEPTGNPVWPYWYYKKIDGRYTWILLHHTHILPLTPGVTAMPGVGLSSVWICLGILAESILINDARIEKLANTVTDGLLLVTGSTDDAGDLKAHINEQREESKAAGYILNKGYTVLTSQEPNANLVHFQFRQESGVTFKERREYEEDVIAHAFSEPLSSVVTRGGVGYGAQAETTADNAGEIGVGAVLHWIATALGAIYPRTQVSFMRSSDRAKRLKLADFKTFAEAVRSLPEETLSTDEIRAMMQRDVVDIPDAGDDTLTTTAGADEDSDESRAVGSSDNQSNEELSAWVLNALALAERLNLDVLYEEDDFLITNEDVDTAIQLAGERVDPDFADLLNAARVED